MGDLKEFEKEIIVDDEEAVEETEQITQETAHRILDYLREHPYHEWPSKDLLKVNGYM